MKRRRSAYIGLAALVILVLVVIPGGLVVLDGLALLVMLFVLLFGMATLAEVFRILVGRLDRHILPKKDLTSLQHWTIGWIFAIGAFFLQPALATLLIVHTPLREVFEPMGQVVPVEDRFNILWGVWGALTFGLAYFHSWKKMLRWR